MMNILPVLLKDGYKAGHKFQYPADTRYIYSNFTPRKSRTGLDECVVFGIQYFLKEYLVNQFQEDFFAFDRETVLRRYKRRMDNYLGKDAIAIDHIEALWTLGTLPLRIKALPEGTLCPMGVPMLTIRNTHPDFFWLPNMLESLMSNILWMPSTSATSAFEYLKNFHRGARRTGANQDFIPWQGHDFSFRGMAGIEAAVLSAAGHLLSFTGTDTIPAIDFLEEYYGANSDLELIGGSVPATEHSVMCIGTPEGEFETFKRLITEVYPGNTDTFSIVSIVSDTWDLWKVVTDFLVRLKSEIMARNGKVVIRPDSGSPADILCGDPDSNVEHVYKGLIECLWDIFGGTTNAKGFKTLDSHIGAIYGDSITLERQKEILRRLEAKGFASDNIVLGIGSYTYQHVTRDSYGFAMKATHGITDSMGMVQIFKKPVTDDGTKNSHRGYLKVTEQNGRLVCSQNVSQEEEHEGLLRTVYHNGSMLNTTTLAEIRARLMSQLESRIRE